MRTELWSFFVAETSDASETAGGGTAHAYAEPECGDATADGNAVRRERTPDKRDSHPEGDHQGGVLSLVELLNQNSAPWSEARTKIFFLGGEGGKAML